MPSNNFPPISDTVALDLLYESNDGVAIVNCMNRLWVHFDSPVLKADVDVLVTDVVQSWTDNIAPLVQTEYILVNVKAKNWNNVLNPVWEYPQTPVPGTLAGDPIPFTSAAIVRWSTDGTAPTGCYIRHGGIVESQVDGQHLGTAAVTAIQAGWDALSDDVTTLTRNHVCVQVYNPGGSSEAGTLYKDAGTVEDIQSIVVRRRLGRAASRQS